MFNAHRFYAKTLKSQFQNPNFYSTISLLHNFTSKKPLISNPAIEFVLKETQAFQSQKTSFSSPAPIEDKFLPQEKIGGVTNTQISHPWREWVDLMHKLLENGYFEAIGNPFANSRELGNKEANLIRTACLNFARDQYQLIRYLTQKDILVIARAGCPSTDRKVINSGKRLRAHVGINEGNICSSCVLRGECDRAYIEARENEGGRTVDVMRFLLTYGLNSIIDSVDNKPCLNKKVEESVRKLLKEMVDIRVEERDRDHKLPRATASHWNSLTEENDVGIERSQIHAPMKQGGWICSKCNFLNFAKNIKCLRCDGGFAERIRKIAEEQDHLPLKKGDWMCDKCNFLNFARNTRCLLCKEKPPKRQLNAGEWECESCNYINFRRNMICLKCDHKRPIASNATENVSQHASNTINNHQIQPSFRQENRVRDEGNKSLEFVENKDQDQRSWNQMPGFMEFPVVGGKSDMSHDIQKRELWMMKMANKGENTICAREDTDRFNSLPFLESEYVASGDGGDDEMAEWFGSSKKT